MGRSPSGMLGTVVYRARRDCQDLDPEVGMALVSTRSPGRGPPQCSAESVVRLGLRAAGVDPGVAVVPTSAEGGA